MKTRSIFLTILMVLLGIGTQHSIAQSLDPPTNLTYTVADENDVTLFWDQPTSGDPEWIHWDDGTNVDGFGFFLNAETWEAAAKWDPSHLSDYDGWYVDKVRFFITSANVDVSFKIYTGSGPTLEHSETISTFEVGSWTEYILTTPWQIDASTELWASLELAQHWGTAPMGIDDGPAIANYGDMIMYQGQWYSNYNWQGFDVNWNIQIYVSPNKKGGSELLGYNVYRDDQQLNIGAVTTPTYVDVNLNNGLYNYYVTALYTDGESDSSNHANVHITQPVILMSDSLALVDLYNSTDGPNWTFSTLWLEGPVNEWQGITTEGTRVKNIFLSNNNLNGEILESFGSLDALESFMASTNEISSLPENFHHLSSLDKLWIGDNQFTELPDSFGYLPVLDELSLGSSNISTLPASFGNLSYLRWFGMYDGGLTSLPDNFGDLSSLESLFLGSNELSELPENFGDLASVTYMTLDNNELGSLPESFGNMSTLETLYAQNNQLSTLPESFGNLSNLRYLNLRVNQLDSLSENFGDLDSLVDLRLSINNLTTLPASFPDLQSLEYLSADQNQLQELPENIGDLASIKILGLSSNDITALPESIGDLSTMTELFVVDNQIETIPESIGDLDVIRRLAMGINNISYVPESIANLSTLLYLDLSENNLDELPSSIGDINPDTVFFFQNQLTELPESMLDNSFLIFWTEDNLLQFGSIEPFIGTANNFIYAPQGMIGKDTVFNIHSGESMEYTIEVSGDYNQYQWYKDGSAVAGQTSNTLYIENVEESDAGAYMLQVTNTIATELTLTSYDATLNVSLVNIEEIDIQDIAIYPNPIDNGKLNMEFHGSETPDRVIVMNSMGQVMASYTPESKKFSANVSEFPAGLYYISIINKNTSVSKKVLIL